MDNQKVLEIWKELKEKLIATITELKANHKDKWAVVKAKSSPASVSLLTTPDLTTLCRLIVSHRNLIKKMSAHSSKFGQIEITEVNDYLLHSSGDQAKYERLVKRLKILQDKLENQRRIALNWQEPSPNVLALVEQEKENIFEELKKANERYDKITDKLELLRKLVNENKLEKLKAMVKRGEI
jgi:hypothetical protein